MQYGKAYKYAIFDLDGTIIDSVESYVNAFHKALSSHNVDVPKKEIQNLLGYSAKKIMSILLEKYAPESIQSLDEIMSTYESIIKTPEFIKSIKQKYKAKETLLWLKRRGIKLYIVSGTMRDMMEQILKNLNMLHIFDDTIATKDDGYKEKPDPESLFALAEKHNINLNDAIYVGDGRLDLELASNAKMKFVAIAGNYFNEEIAYEKQIGFVYELPELKRYFMKKIIALSGLAGSGKSTAKDMFKKNYNFSTLRFGDLTIEILKERNLEINEQNEKLIREELREKHGMHAYAKLSLPKINKLLEKSDTILIDGLYSWEEYLYLKEHIEEKDVAKLILVSVLAPKDARYYRLRNRSVRALNEEEAYFRDLHELKNTNKALTIAMSDYFLWNNKTPTELEQQIKEFVARYL